MNRIHLVRHGVTEWNRSGRFQGHIDVPLSAEGRHQAAAVAERLGTLPLIRCFSSDLARARETAEIIVERSGIVLELDADLREANKGVLEGKYWDPSTQLLGDESHYHDEFDLGARPPGGESLLDVRDRCVRFIERLSEPKDKLGTGDTLIVGHGGTLRMMLAELLNLTAAASSSFRFDNCSLTTVQFRNPAPPLLVCYNDCSHFSIRD